MLRKSKKTKTSQPREDNVLVTRNHRFENNSDLSGVMKAVRVIRPAKSFDAPFTTLEEFTDNVMGEISQDKSKRKKHWKVTLKDYLAATDSRLIYFLKICLAVMSVGVGILLAIFLLHLLKTSTAVTAGYLILGPIFRRPRTASSRDPNRS